MLTVDHLFHLTDLFICTVVRFVRNEGLAHAAVFLDELNVQGRRHVSQSLLVGQQKGIGGIDLNLVMDFVDDQTELLLPNCTRLSPGAFHIIEVFAHYGVLHYEGGEVFFFLHQHSLESGQRHQLLLGRFLYNREKCDPLLNVHVVLYADQP